MAFDRMVDVHFDDSSQEREEAIRGNIGRWAVVETYAGIFSGVLGDHPGNPLRYNGCYVINPCDGRPPFTLNYCCLMSLQVRDQRNQDPLQWSCS